MAERTQEWYKAHALALTAILNDTLTELAGAGRTCEGVMVFFEHILRKLARSAAEKEMAEITQAGRSQDPLAAISSYIGLQVGSGLLEPDSVRVTSLPQGIVRVSWPASECLYRPHCAKVIETGLACACAQRLCVEEAAACAAGLPLSSEVVTALDGELCAFDIFPPRAEAPEARGNPCGHSASDGSRAALERQAWSRLEAQYQLLLETIADAIVVVDNNGKVTYVNPRACGVFGVPPAQALGALFRTGGPLGRIGDLCLEAAQELGKWEGIKQIENRDGERVHNIYLTRFSPIFSREHSRIGTMIVLEDITREEMLHRKLAAQTENLERIVKEKTRELQEANAKLEILARTDPLTGLANRRTFEEVLRSELLRSGRYKHSTGVLMVDVDDFKQVNDKLGHQTGDVVLKYVASILSKSVRASDTVARWGGDEFILLLPQAGASECKAVARRISENLLIENASGEAVPGLAVGLSVGWATAIGGAADALVAKADKTMYNNKAAKKTKVRQDGSNTSQPHA